eukprot:GEMP01053518.1.p1 GENE.GEMP01053518.1~~GEMP01053518.1.p1  ORF type:complete len:225 (+),score=10.95 GEMP01053518.1:162-836(+)
MNRVEWDAKGEHAYEDEEMGLLQKGSGVRSGITREDPELISYGGPYTTKYQFMMVTIRLPESNPLAIIAVNYGFMMYCIPALMLFGYFMIPDAFLLMYGFLMIIVVIAINEGFLKPHIDDPRPAQTAIVRSDGSPQHGMPSCHSAVAYALLVWSVWEVVTAPSRLGMHRELWILMLIIVLAPVPWSRWYNRDHTALQSIVGAALGLAIGLIFAQQRPYFFPYSV